MQELIDIFATTIITNLKIPIHPHQLAHQNLYLWLEKFCHQHFNHINEVIENN